MRKAIVILALLLISAIPAHAGGCANVTVTNASTAVFTDHDLGQPTRTFCVQNNDPAGQDAWCTFADTAAPRKGFYLAKGGGQLCGNEYPEDAMNCITASGSTTVYACDQVP